MVRGLVQNFATGAESITELELFDLADEEPELVARFFEATATFHRTRPWTYLDSDDDILLLDAPLLGWKHACASILGMAGETMGVAWYASAADHERFRLAGERLDVDDPDAKPPSIETRAVTFEPLDSLPPPMRTELSLRGWKLDGPKALPFPMRTDRRGRQVRFERDDVVQAVAPCEALARFFTTHGGALRDTPARCSEAAEVRVGGRTIRVTMTWPRPDRALAEPPGVPSVVETDEERTSARFLAEWSALSRTLRGRGGRRHRGDGVRDPRTTTNARRRRAALAAG